MLEVGIGSVTTKGQVTIPKEIRDALGIREGDKLIFVLEGERILVKRASGERLTEILSRQRPWPEASLAFQRRLRAEWGSRRS